MTIEQKIERLLFLQKHLVCEKITRKGLVNRPYLIDSMLNRMEKEFVIQE